MEFFNELSQLLTGTKKVTIIAQQVGDQLTVGFFPEFASKDLNEKVKMVSITGTPQEMDEGFFAEIRKPIEAASTGLKSNAEEVATEIKAAAEEELADEKAEAERKEKAASKKSAPVKKAAPTKKAEVKKPETKKPAPKKEDKKKVDPDHNEGTTAEEIIENASIEEVKVEEVKVEEEISKSAQEIISDTVDNDILNPEKQEPENLEIVEDKKEDEVIPEDVIEPVQPAESTEESSDQSKFDQYMQDGDEHMKAKNYQLARTTFQNAMVLADASGNQSNIGKAYKAEANAARWVRAIERMNA